MAVRIKFIFRDFFYSCYSSFLTFRLEMREVFRYLQKSDYQLLLKRIEALEKY
nr:hypothetical protein [uncultured bacterium]